MYLLILFLDIFDFVADSTSILFPANSRQICVQIGIISDPVGWGYQESTETFSVSFVAAGPLGGGVTSATGQSIVTLADVLPEG